MNFCRFGRLEKRIVGFFIVRFAIKQNARRNLREELNVGERVFKHLGYIDKFFTEEPGANWDGAHTLNNK